MSSKGYPIPPRPSVMIESLRSVGYETTTAVADIIDNSISAGAGEIDVIFHWDGKNSYVTIRDDGRGMEQPELLEAMRLGSRDPREKRDKNDLGRFGLGLKTASFSQCLKLTVVSRKKGSTPVSLCWDLNHVRKAESWEVLPVAGPLIDKSISSLGRAGTVVIWQKLDRVCDAEASDEDILASQDAFLHLASTVESHISVTFHRFLTGSGKIRISMNGNPIKAWDPFLVDNPASQNPQRSEISYKGDKILVSCHVLPHHTKLSPSEWKEAGGPLGWGASQGFYVYRNKRLLMAGDWLGLGFRKEEHYKLTRISVDIPNTLDQYWDLDVKKSRALVPWGLKRTLTSLAKATRERAASVYRHRGKIVGRESAKAAFLWVQKTVRSKLHYEISRQHPAVAAMLRNADGRKSQLESLLRLIEESIPVPAIVLECSQKEDALAHPFEGVQQEEIYRIFALSLSAMVDNGATKSEALNHLRNAEPFNAYPEVLENLFDYMEKKR